MLIVPEQVHPLDFLVLAAEYSAALDRIVVAARNPDGGRDPFQLVLIEPESRLIEVIPLPRTPRPRALAVGADGVTVVVAHDGALTRVEVESHEVETIPVPIDPSAVVLRQRTAYLVPIRRPGPMWTVDLDTGVQSEQGNVRDGGWARLHPDQDRIYVTDQGTSVSKIERLDVRGDGTLGDKTEFPYHSEHQTGTGLWISEDGARLYAGTGNIFRSSPDPAVDMVYEEALWIPPGRRRSDARTLQSLCDSSPWLAAIARPLFSSNNQSDDDGLLYFYDEMSLWRHYRAPFPPFRSADREWKARGRQVFCATDGNFYAIVEAEARSEMLRPFALVTVPRESIRARDAEGGGTI